jgi:hypothetical protein
MEGRPYDEHWERIFASLDVQSLFKLSLRSNDMFQLVMQYVRTHMPAPCHGDERKSSPTRERGSAKMIAVLTGGPLDSFSKLPFELLHIIFAHMHIADKISLARLSRKFRAMCARELQAATTRLLAAYHLTHSEVRFMQTATSTLISGCAVANVLKSDFTPSTIDFIAPNDAYPSVIRFFDLATPYDAFPAETLHSENGAIHVTALCGATMPRSVYLFRSETNSALDCIPYAKFSHLMLALTHYGLWIGYPEAAAAGVSYPNRDTVDFADSGTKYSVKTLLREAVHNFRFQFTLNRHHRCGVSFECPTTPRTTKDDGCLNLFFPGLPIGAPLEKTHVYPSDCAMAWSLGGRHCPPGAADAPRGVQIRQRRDGCES